MASNYRATTLDFLHVPPLLWDSRNNANPPPSVKKVRAYTIFLPFVTSHDRKERRVLGKGANIPRSCWKNNKKKTHLLTWIPIHFHKSTRIDSNYNYPPPSPFFSPTSFFFLLILVFSQMQQFYFTNWKLKSFSFRSLGNSEVQTNVTCLPNLLLPPHKKPFPNPWKGKNRKWKGKVKGKSAPNFVHIPLPSGPEWPTLKCGTQLKVMQTQPCLPKGKETNP